jgi:hypothetical protein
LSVANDFFPEPEEDAFPPAGQALAIGILS